MINGVSKVVIDVAEQDRARDFWIATMGFTLAQDSPFGEERWLEVRSPDGTVNLVLRPTPADDGTHQGVPSALPTSNVFFYCDDVPETYRVLAARGVAFPQPPVEQPFGWWSMFEDEEGNRFALVARGDSSSAPPTNDHGGTGV